MTEVISVGEGRHIEARCPYCDGLLRPKGEEMWRCPRCPKGPFEVDL